MNTEQLRTKLLTLLDEAISATWLAFGQNRHLLQALQAYTREAPETELAKVLLFYEQMSKESEQ